jgi:FKBP-type peptidyl-prolyl cis-trans isomerase FklB
MISRSTTAMAALLGLCAACGARTTSEPDPAVGDIQLTYKRDPRLVDPYRGQGPWVAGPGYSGATAQDRVVTRARTLDPKGQPVAATLRWVPSDPAMVTVSPAEGGEVTIAVHKDGESRLKVEAAGFARELTVRARRQATFLVFEIVPAAAPSPPSADAAMSPALGGQKQQVSYAVGLNLARTLQKQSVPVDPDLVRQGFVDAMSGGPTLMSEEQAHLLLISVETEIDVTDAQLERKRTAEKNRAAGERFLAENRDRPGVVALPSGLQYRVITAGQGRKPTLDDVAVCHYQGRFLDGTEFDSSYRRKAHEPVRFPVKGIIKGWQEALQLMPAGSKWELFVPPDLAYGERGAPRSRIGPNTTLVFEVELLSVEPPGARPRVAAAKHSKAELPPELMVELKKAMKAPAKVP